MVCEIIELELLEIDNDEINLDMDFSGDYVSGNSGEEWQEGYDKGYQKGYEDGEKEGYSNGYGKGESDGYSNGYKDGQINGYSSGFGDGQTDGYSKGYDKGKTDGESEGYTKGYEQGKSDGYADGYNQGYSDGYNEGYEKAKSETDSYYDTFWDSYLPSEEINGEYIFAGCSWNDDTFAPNKNIKPTLACSMFENCRITDLDGILKNKGVVLDTSNCINFSSMFYGSTITKLGVIDLSGCYDVGTRFSSAFRTSTLQSIEKLILLSKDFAYDNSMFNKASSLTDIVVEGTIYQTFTISASPLTVDSMKSIILALNNYAGTDKEFSYSIKFSSACLTALEADGNTAPDGGTWNDYIYNKGWLY